MKIEFHYDFGSPNAYLVHKVIPATTKETGIEFEYVPILLGGVFKATNNVSPAVSLQGIRNKPDYQLIETERFCRDHGIQPAVPNPHFPVNTLKIMRGAVFARSTDVYQRYIDAMYAAMWEQALKLDEDDVIIGVLDAAGLRTRELLERMNDPAIKQELIAQTEASVNRGTFGSPTLYVQDQIFFGKDKLRDATEVVQRSGREIQEKDSGK